MNRRWFIGATAVVVVGSVVAGTAEQVCPSYIVRTKLNVTRFQLEIEDLAVSQYRAEKGTAPDSLAAINGPGARGEQVDAWGRPLVYRRLDGGNGYILYSLGANGIDENGAGDDVFMAKSPKKYHCEDYDELCVNPCQVTKGGAALAALVALMGIAAYAGYAGLQAVVRRVA